MNKHFQSLKVILIAAVIFATISVANAWTVSAGQALIDALKVKGPLTFCNEPVPLNETDVKESLERELLVSLNNSDDVILWLKRSNRYFPHIEKTLKDNGLPDDLKYIVIVESFLKPLATSHKGAVGYWQFIERTGSRYGMKINQDTDERRNFFISTQAALAYLKDLSSIFNSWTLAAAAYNMGEDGLKTEMLMQKVNNFYHLYLNQETQRYIFKILAAKIILSNPDKFGFHLTEDDLYKPVQFDTVEVTTNQSLPIYLIATAANSYFKEIKGLNPQLKNYLPAGKHIILVPRGAASGFNERYELLLKQWLEEKNKSVYTVVRGDNLSTIAKRFNVSIKAIMNWNGITNAKIVSPGDKLVIFTDTNISDPSKK
ncbi:MAG: transglycosylase SLT domain-containing protein [Smithella sp.]